MPTPPISDEVLEQTVEVWLKHNRVKLYAAKELGVADTTFAHRLRVAASRGLLPRDPVMPGFRIAKVSTSMDAAGNVLREHVQQRPDLGEQFEVPAGHAIKGVSSLVDADGRTVQKWIKTSNHPSPDAIASTLKEAFRDYEYTAPEIPAPEQSHAERLALYPLADLHLGMFSWGKETGVDWDLNIAERVIGRSYDELVERSAPADTCIVLGGGDLLHSDNSSNTTSRSGNPLQVDGRYPKVMQTAARVTSRIIEAAARKHSNVIVRILPGNHDEHSAIAIALILAERFRHQPRIHVDLDPGLFFWHRHGKVLLGSTHGHSVKMADMPGIMAARRAQDWGETLFRYVHGFHVHHKSMLATEGKGVIVETHRSLVPQDAWHHNSGYLAGRSVTSICYHAERGEVSRSTVAVMDDA